MTTTRDNREDITYTDMKVLQVGVQSSPLIPILPINTNLISRKIHQPPCRRPDSQTLKTMPRK